MRIFLTGGSGFLGSHIAEFLTGNGHQVVAAVRATSVTDQLETSGAELVRAPLHDRGALQAGMAGADAVVHVAARVHTEGAWREFVDVTIDGTRNVVAAAAAAGVPHFVQMSSVGVYGYPRADGRPFDESCGYGCQHRWNYYSRAKIEAEKIVTAAQASGRMATTILRPTWVYGPRDTTSLTRIVAALRAGRLRWIGDGSNVLSLVYVSDVVTAVALVLDQPADGGRIYNVATDDPALTQDRFIRRLCRLLELEPPRQRISYAAAHRLGYLGECLAHLTGYRVTPPISRLGALLLGGHRRYDAGLIERELGWEPSVRFDQGIRETVDAYRQARDR